MQRSHALWLDQTLVNAYVIYTVRGRRLMRHFSRIALHSFTKRKKKEIRKAKYNWELLTHHLPPRPHPPVKRTILHRNNLPHLALHLRLILPSLFFTTLSTHVCSIPDHIPPVANTQRLLSCFRATRHPFSICRLHPPYPSIATIAGESPRAPFNNDRSLRTNSLRQNKRHVGVCLHNPVPLPLLWHVWSRRCGCRGNALPRQI